MSKHSSMDAKRFLLLGATVASAFFVGGTEAYAQDNAAAADNSEIVVTGTRIVRRDFTSASPIVTVDAGTFSEYSAITPDQVLQTLPQFGASFGAGSNNTGNSGVASLNLHYLGSARTLVLIDGRRTVGADGGAAVDVGMIPQSLIKSVEIVSGGASAVYGSDAVAGVVNFILDSKYEGAKLSAFVGAAEEGDGEQYAFDGVFGRRVGKGGFVAYAGVSQREEVQVTDRDNFPTFQSPNFGPNGEFLGFSPAPNNNLPEGLYDPGTNRPSQAALNTVFGGYGLAAGSVAPTSTIGFNADGTLFTNVPLQNYRGTNAKGSPYYDNEFLDNVFQLPAERLQAGAFFDWAFSPHAEVYGQVSFMQSEVVRQINPFSLSTAVSPLNPFVPADLATLLQSRPNATATVSIRRNLRELGPRRTAYDSDLYNTALGVRGDIGSGWSYDAVVTYGSLTRTETAGGALSTARLTELLTAPDGGASLCAGGLDLFGPNFSAACARYITYTPVTETISQQWATEAIATGPLFELPAGWVQAAVGVSGRWEDFKVKGDPLVNAGGVSGGLRTQSSIRGETDVQEIFAEIAVPILRDLPFVKSLDATFGYRYSDYDLYGGTEAYKAEAVWAPVESLRLRGSYQRAVRAPNVNEAFLAPTAVTTQQTQVDPCNVNSTYRLGQVAGVSASSVRALCLAQGVPEAIIDTVTTLPRSGITGFFVGNKDLTPEEADTFTMGVVFSPNLETPLLTDLRASLDFYSIEIVDAISNISFDTAVSRCFNLFGGNPSYNPSSQYCQQFTRNSSGGLTNGITTNLNASALETEGLDLQVDWTIPVAGPFGFQGVNVSTLVSQLLKFDQAIIATDPLIELKGTIAGAVAQSLPEWKSTVSAEFDFDRFAVGLRWRHISEMETQTERLTPAANTVGVPSVDYVDLTLRLLLSDKLSVIGGIDNLSNEEAPLYSTPTPGNNTDPTTYDVVGRRGYLRLSYEF